MSGLYNVLFGQSKSAPVLLGVIGLEQGSFYRFRDCYLSEAGEIAVYTRGGGGNRECYCANGGHPHEDGCVVPTQDALREHPCYLRDDDDEFDSTYATFYFKIPENLDREKLAGIDPELKREEVWAQFFDSMRAATKGASEA